VENDMITDYRNRRALPSLWAIVFLAVCCALSMVIAFRARAAAAADTPPAATAQDTASKDTPAKAADEPTADKGKAEAGTTRPPPSKAEESATIEDDPTLVPDSKESADNNVTFPIDI
jgi:cytoskeletal protein RodZ